MDDDRVIELLEKIRETTERTNRALEVHIAESIPVRELVDKHERTLFGTNGRKALMSRVDQLEEDVKRLKEEDREMKDKLREIEKREEERRESLRRNIIGVIVTFLLSAIGYGIIYMIAEFIK